MIKSFQYLSKTTQLRSQKPPCCTLGHISNIIMAVSNGWSNGFSNFINKEVTSCLRQLVLYSILFQPFRAYCKNTTKIYCCNLKAGGWLLCEAGLESSLVEVLHYPKISNIPFVLQEESIFNFSGTKQIPSFMDSLYVHTFNYPERLNIFSFYKITIMQIKDATLSYPCIYFNKSSKVHH